MTLLQELTRNGQVWTGQDWRRTHQQAHPSGHPILDAELPGGGWPLGAVTEILVPHPGHGELRLLLPALADLSQNDSRWQVWFNPPLHPYAPGLAQWGLALNRLLVCEAPGKDDLLWSLEQCLNTGGSQAVVAWLDQLDKSRMRRLQLAAEKGRIPVFLLRPARFESAPSVAALRLHLVAQAPDRIGLHILKRRAGWPVYDLSLPLPLFGAEEANDE